MYDFDKVQSAFNITKKLIDSLQEEIEDYKEKAKNANSEFVKGMYEGIVIAKEIEINHLKMIMDELYQ